MALGKRKRKNYKTGRQILIMIIELLVVFILGVVIYGWYQWARIGHDKLDADKLEIFKKNRKYTNIALYGLDSRGKELKGGVNSDTIMIASINNKTKEVKLVSVYRDCIMRQADGSYAKANRAYSLGGGELAIAELNRNLDLDIENYVSVNFIAMVKAIDAVGGLEIDVTEEEVPQINKYAKEVKKASGVSSPKVTHAGKQTLNGVQATAYARIRKTEGGDFKRAERQRLVLKMLIDKTRKLSKRKLKRMAEDLLPYIATSLSAKEVMGLAINASKFELTGTKGFPFEVTTMENPRNMVGSFVVPITMASNVTELHAYCFGEKDYQPSQTILDISKDIEWLTSVHPGVVNIYDQDGKQDNE